MSNNEIGKINGTIYSANFQLAAGAYSGIFPYQVGGVGVNLSSPATPITPNSRILGVKRVNAAGGATTASTPITVSFNMGADAAAQQALTATGNVNIIATSALPADISLCTLYWINETANGLIPV